MRTVRVWGVFPGSALTFAFVSVILAASANAEGDSLATGAEESLAATSDGGKVTVFMKRGSTSFTRIDNTGKQKPSICFRKTASSLAITPDGKFAVVGGADALVVFSLDARVEVQRTYDLGGPVGTVAISPDGKTVAAAHPQGDAAFLLDAASGKKFRTLKYEEKITALRFSPDGTALAVGSKSGKLRLWSIESGKSSWEQRLHEGDVQAIAFFPCGKKLASGSADGTVCVAEAGTGKTLASYRAHRHTVWHVAVSLDGRYVGSCGLEKTLTVWDAEDRKTVATEKIDSGSAGLAFSQTHLFVADATSLRTFDLKTKRLSEPRELK
jgi:WD40 repeat protein